VASFDDHATTATTEPPLTLELVELEELQARPIRVVSSPLPTMLAILDAARGRGGGVPDAWARAAGDALSVADLRALDPVVARPHGFVPDCLLGLTGAADRDPDAELDRIAEVDGESVLAELTAPGGPGMIGAWKAVAADPDRWTRRYARTMARIWEAMRAEWTAAAPLIDDEAVRVEAAIDRGAAGDAVRHLHPAGGVRGDLWVLPGREPRRLRIARRGLTLLPKLTGRRSPAIRAYERDRLSHLAYPLPGATRELGELPPPSALEALLGGQRSPLRRRPDGGAQDPRRDLLAIPRRRERLA